jgi:hypothetical protein
MQIVKRMHTARIVVLTIALSAGGGADVVRCRIPSSMTTQK